MEETNERMDYNLVFAYCADVKNRKLVGANRYFCTICTEYETVNMMIIATDVIDMYRQIVEFIQSDEGRFGSPDYGSVTYNISRR